MAPDLASISASYLVVATAISIVVAQACTNDPSLCPVGQLCFDGSCRVPHKGDRCNGIANCDTTGIPLACQFHPSTPDQRCYEVRSRHATCGAEYQTCNTTAGLECRAATEGAPVTCEQALVGIDADCSNAPCTTFSQCLKNPDGSQTCQSNLKEGQTCKSGSRFEACEYNHICLNDKCVPMRVQGETCNNKDLLCRGPPATWQPVFNCTQTSSGEKRCFDSVGLSSQCGETVNSLCGTGLVCAGGKCAEPNGAGSACGPGCGSGFQCKSDNGFDRCFKIVQEAQYCSGTDQFLTCAEGLTCGTSGRCEGAPRTAGQPCGSNQGVACENGLSCLAEDLSPVFDVDMNGTCVKLVPRGGRCNGANTACSREQGPSDCKNGTCVESNVARFGETCGNGTNFVCCNGDGCGARALECKLTFGNGAPLEQYLCVVTDLQPGERCQLGMKGSRVTRFCAKGSCEYDALEDENFNQRAACVVRASEGERCNYDQFIRCQYGYACASGVCRKDPTI